MSDLKESLIKLGYEKPELRPHLREVIATLDKTAKLMARQVKVLENYVRGVHGTLPMFYDELPMQVRADLERIKDQETLWSDVERWLGDEYSKRLRNS